MASIRNSSSKKGLLEHTKPVQYPLSCMYSYFGFADVFLQANLIWKITYIPLHILTSKGKSGLPFLFWVWTLCRYWLLMFRSRLMEGANIISVKSVILLANLLWQKSLSLDRSAWDVDSELASDLYERWQKIRRGEACRSVQILLRFLIQASTAL